MIVSLPGNSRVLGRDFLVMSGVVPDFSGKWFKSGWFRHVFGLRNLIQRLPGL